MYRYYRGIQKARYSDIEGLEDVGQRLDFVSVAVVLPDDEETVEKSADRFFGLNLDDDGVEVVWVRNQILDGIGPDITLIVLVKP